MRGKILILMLAMLAVAGCDSLRLPASEKMKQNAWLHERTTARAAQTAQVEGASDELCKLTELSQLQSRAFVADYGLPEVFPPADRPGDFAGPQARALAGQAELDAGRKLNGWDVADGALEMGIGLAGLAGGVWGMRLASFCAKARSKAKALQEVIEGNETFKSQNHQLVSDFKQAHRHQSPQTRQLVAEIKNGGTS